LYEAEFPAIVDYTADQGKVKGVAENTVFLIFARPFPVFISYMKIADGQRLLTRDQLVAYFAS